MEFYEVTKLALESSIIWKKQELDMGKTSFHVWLPTCHGY